MSSRRFIVDDDESLSDEPGGAAARREHDPEDESDLDGDLTSDDDNAVSRRLKRNANRRGAPVKTRSSTTAAATKAKTAAGRGKAWEGQFERTWDQVQEDEHGTLEGAVSDLLLSYKSRRCALLADSGQGVDRFKLTHLPPNGENSVLRDTASIQRGIIRHVYLVIDLSSAMLVRDYKATWLDLTLQYAQVRPSRICLFREVEKHSLRRTRWIQEFVTEFFDQNPIGQMAIMVTRDGLAERLTPLSGAVFVSPSPPSAPPKLTLTSNR